MINKKELLKRLDKMSPEDIVKLIYKALEESETPYEEGKDRVIFNGLLSLSPCNGCVYQFDWGYPGCKDCARMYQDKYAKKGE